MASRKPRFFFFTPTGEVGGLAPVDMGRSWSSVNIFGKLYLVVNSSRVDGCELNDLKENLTGSHCLPVDLNCTRFMLISA